MWASFFSNEKKHTGLDLNVCAIFSRASTEMLSLFLSEENNKLKKLMLGDSNEPKPNQQPQGKSQCKYSSH